MAKKRDSRVGLPASPLAAKLAQQVNEPFRAAPPTAPPPSERTPSAPVSLPAKISLHTPKHEINAPARKPKRTHKFKESRVMLDADEWAMKEEVVGALRRATGQQVEFSHLMRSLLGLASGAIPSIESNASHASLPSRPANNDLMALASFEDELGKFLLLAFRDKKAMDAD